MWLTLPTQISGTEFLLWMYQGIKFDRYDLSFDLK